VILGYADKQCDDQKNLQIIQETGVQELQEYRIGGAETGSVTLPVAE
jgi:hypothetical protein